MTEKELKHLSRAELLEMLLARTEENEKLKTRLEEAEAALLDRHIEIEKSGSMAEAAIRLNHIFEAADAAARQYLENLKRLSGEAELRRGRIEAEAMKRAEARLKEAETYSRTVRADADAYVKKTHEEGDAYLQEVRASVAKLLREQENLRSLLDAEIGAPET